MVESPTSQSSFPIVSSERFVSGCTIHPNKRATLVPKLTYRSFQYLMHFVISSNLKQSNNSESIIVIDWIGVN